MTDLAPALGLSLKLALILSLAALLPLSLRLALPLKSPKELLVLSLALILALCLARDTAVNHADLGLVRDRHVDRIAADVDGVAVQVDICVGVGVDVRVPDRTCTAQGAAKDRGQRRRPGGGSRSGRPWSLSRAPRSLWCSSRTWKTW